MRVVDHWRDERNAHMYDRFTRQFPLYRLTSTDLVRCAELQPDSHVLDLACGTGVTTAAVLDVLGPTGRVTAVDASAAMLQIAAERVQDPRVTWLEARAEQIATFVNPGFSHVVCNSAIWQMDVLKVTAAVSGLLAPHGRFACTIGTNRRPDGSTAPPPQKPSLHDLMRAYAVIDHGFVFQPSRRLRRLMDDDGLRDQLVEGGLNVLQTEYVEYAFDPNQAYAWSKVPIFTEHFARLTYEQRMDALDKAWAKLDPHAQPPSRWAILVAERRP
jgi:ubiquinone/menaquinone biosynthesis C-methylase UbiE